MHCLQFLGALFLPAHSGGRFISLSRCLRLSALLISFTCLSHSVKTFVADANAWSALTVGATFARIRYLRRRWHEVVAVALTQPAFILMSVPEGAIPAVLWLLFCISRCSPEFYIFLHGSSLPDSLDSVVIKKRVWNRSYQAISNTRKCILYSILYSITP